MASDRPSEPGRVSVVIAAYNAADTLHEALDSLAQQTFRDLEVIVVDDASADATRAVAEAELSKLAHHRLLALRVNGGPAAARNRGIAEASGEWIAFLDADDAWVPWRLEMQMQLVREQPDVALVCGTTIDFGAPCAAQPGGARPLRLEEFATHNPVATSTVLVRRRVVVSVGGFDAQFRGPEDYDLWMRIAARYRAVLMDAVLARYRHRPGSLSMDERRFLPEVLRVLAKAFRTGGALSAHPALKRRAIANQYWNASWMAFNRGARLTALRYLAAAFSRDRHVGGSLRLPLLWRYLFGRPVDGQAAGAKREGGPWTRT